MVRKFQAERSRLDQVLCRANEQCPIMLEELNGFEDYLTFQPVKIVGKRLLAITYWISSLVRSRYKEHWGKGYVCVVISNKGKIIIWWVENKQIVADKRPYEASGLTILSEEEALAMIKDLVGKLCKGNWEQVVVWMNSHGL